MAEFQCGQSRLSFMEVAMRWNIPLGVETLVGDFSMVIRATRGKIKSKDLTPIFQSYSLI